MSIFAIKRLDYTLNKANYLPANYFIVKLLRLATVIVPPTDTSQIPKI